MGIGCQMALWEDHYRPIPVPIEVVELWQLAIMAARSGFYNYKIRLVGSDLWPRFSLFCTSGTSQMKLKADIKGQKGISLFQG